MDHLILIWIFILWTIFGSFWSVVLTRFSDTINWNIFRSFLFGQSKCPKCSHVLKTKNLVPILSYVWQKWKCQYCGDKISLVYPMLEILSGLIFVLTYIISTHWWNLWNLEIFFWMIVNRWFLILIFQDFFRYELHFFAWIIVLAVSLFFQFFWFIWDYKWAFLGSVFFGLIYYLIYFLSNKYTKLKYNKPDWGFGIGDVYFAFLVWTLISFVFEYNWLIAGISDLLIFILLFVIVSGLLGLIYGIVMFFFKKNDKNFMNFRIPFIPSMICAFWILLLFGKYFYKLLFF